MTRGSRRTRRTNPTETLIALLAASLACVSVLAGSMTAAAGHEQIHAGGVEIEVVDQSTFVAADGTLTIELAIGAADQLLAVPTPHELSVTVFGRLGSEAEVDEPLSQPLNRLPAIPLASLDRPAGDRFRLELPVRSGPRFDGLDRVLLPNPGVYPISIELRSAAGPMAATRTHLVRLTQETSEDGQTAAPMPVAIVLDVSTAEGLTVADVQRLLTDHPTVPITVVLQEGVENQLRADPELAAGFVAALAGRPVLAVPAVDLDPSALAEIDQSRLYVEHEMAARQRLEDLGLVVADGIGLIEGPLTSAGAGVLKDLGFRTVLDTGEDRAGNGRLGSGRDRLQVLRIDRELSRILGGGDDGPHRANRVLARLTLRSEVDDAPVVLGGSALGVDPGAAVGAFLLALSQPGAPQPILLSELSDGPPLRPAERPQQDLTPIADLLRVVQEKLATYEAFYHDGGNAPDHFRRQILSSLTMQRNPRDREGALMLLDSQLDDDLRVIELHDGQPVTLAARSTPFPIFVESDAGGPRKVMLRIDSDKVVAAEDEQVVVVEPGTSSIDVVLETRSLGISPLEVSVWTPDGATLLANTRFEIRSTAVPGLGVLVSIGAGALLGAWWFLDARRRRHSADPRPAAVDTEMNSGRWSDSV